MPDRGYLSFDFLDVGQGDGTFIVTPQYDTILVDMGSKKNADVAGGDAVTYVRNQLLGIQTLKKLAKPTLDYLFLTHGDGDHYNLIKPLRDSFAPAMELLFNKIFIGGLKSEYGGLQDFLTAQEKVFGNLSEFGDCQHDAIGSPSWTFDGGLSVYLLSVNVPNKTNSYPGGKNQKSIVLQFQYAGRKVVLTGDAESLMEGCVLKWYEKDLSFLKSDFLKLGHHGSQAGTTTNWLKAVQPYWVFVSSDQKWAHPYCGTIKRVKDDDPRFDTTTGNHPWLCGQGANASKQYYNHFGKVEGTWGVFSTLAFQTFKKEDMDTSEGAVMTEIRVVFDPTGVLPVGLVQGAQYQLQIAKNGDINLTTTLG